VRPGAQAGLPRIGLCDVEDPAVNSISWPTRIKQTLNFAPGILVQKCSRSLKYNVFLLFMSLGKLGFAAAFTNIGYWLGAVTVAACMARILAGAHRGANGLRRVFGQA
jgi:hypothetical protein